MRTRIALPTLILAGLAAFPCVHPAAAGPWGLPPGEWYANLEGSTFSSRSFHLASGTRVDTGLAVDQHMLRLHHELGWKHGLTFQFNLPAMSVTRRDARVQGTATGFQDVFLGVRRSFSNRATAGAIEITWSVPAGYNRNLDSLGLQLDDGLVSRETFPGSISRIPRFRGKVRQYPDSVTSFRFQKSDAGLQELGLGFHFGTALGGRGFLEASVGYAYRYMAFGGHRVEQLGDLYHIAADSLRVLVPGVLDTTVAVHGVVGFKASPGTWANRVHLSADLGVWVSPSFMAGGRYRGLWTVANGPLVPQTTRHLAGPLVLYRLDDRLDMFAGSWSTASGKNTLHFDQVYVGIAFHHATLNRLQGFLGGKQSP